jgi:hypothetical protein
MESLNHRIRHHRSSSSRSFLPTDTARSYFVLRRKVQAGEGYHWMATSVIGLGIVVALLRAFMNFAGPL